MNAVREEEEGGEEEGGDEAEILCTVQALRLQYRENPFILAKLKTIVCSQLPIVLGTWKLLEEKRAARHGELHEMQEAFIREFSSRHRFYWCSSTDLYFSLEKTGEVALVTEDDIVYLILRTISKEHPALMCWKQKTKHAIMKKVRNASPFSLLQETPEGDVGLLVERLYVRGRYADLFPTRKEFVYFLVIVGDILLKKGSGTPDVHHHHHHHLWFFISSQSKPFLQRLSEYSEYYVGVNLLPHFKHSYHGGSVASLDKCRIVPFLLVEGAGEDEEEGAAAGVRGRGGGPQPFLTELFLASHLSAKHQNSDAFLEQDEEEDEEERGSERGSLRARCLYLKNESPASMVATFSEKYLVRGGGGGGGAKGKKMGWKHMYYLWKHFLRSCLQLPSTTVMSKQKFKENVIEVMRDCYNADEDHFEHVHSPFLPIVEQFMSFWDKHIVVAAVEEGGDEGDEEEDEEDESSGGGCHYSVEEIQKLFLLWKSSSSSSSSSSTSSCCGSSPLSSLTSSSEPAAAAAAAAVSLGKKQILDIIKYYYPGIGVRVGGGEGRRKNNTNKVIRRIRCILWDKELEMRRFWEAVAAAAAGTANTTKLAALYSDYMKMPSHAMKVTWNYFKKSHARFERDRVVVVVAGRGFGGGGGGGFGGGGLTN